MRLLTITAAAMLGFAANSLLTRAAITGGHLDAWAFMVIRLVTGAAMLALLVSLRQAPASSPDSRPRGRGSWPMTLGLAGYAVLFTLAYVRIDAAPGALLLFGSVQLTMFAVALSRGETLSRWHWIGVALALGGFLVLTLPGLTAPDPVGAILMAGSGICWGLYSILGRRAVDPLGVTADNFLRASGVVLIIALAAGLGSRFSVTGLVLATASGALASGLAYAAWYSVLPALPVWRAATVQLTVPILTALGAAVFLSESLTPRLGGAMALVVTGIWLTTSTPKPSR